MNPTLDKMQPYTMVGNRLPLAYMQDGHGYDRSGGYLGEYNAQGERADGAVEPAVEAVEAVAEPVAEPAAEPVAEAVSEQPDTYKGVRAASLKKMCEARGLDFEPNATREELIGILNRG